MSTKSLKLYSRFHGREPKSKGTVRFDVPKGFVFLGEAVEIVYRCDKLNGGGDGTKAEYAHKCGKGNILCTDEKGEVLFIFGKKQKVTDRGIVD